VGEEGISEGFKTLILSNNNESDSSKSSDMLNLLLRYVTLTKSISDSIATDQFSTYVHPDSSASKSIGSFRDSEDSFLDLISITDDVHGKLEDIDEIIADNDEEGGE
jgi:hypothetical protein